MSQYTGKVVFSVVLKLSQRQQSPGGALGRYVKLTDSEWERRHRPRRYTSAWWSTVWCCHSERCL